MIKYIKNDTKSGKASSCFSLIVRSEKRDVFVGY